MNEIISANCEKTLANVVTALKIMAGINESEGLLCADTNQDNRIDMNDVIYQLQCISGVRE